MPRSTAPAVCTVCGTTISRKSDLPRHMRQHSDNIEALYYRCKVKGCGYKNLQKSNLVTHSRTHTGQKTKHCPTCDFRTTDPGSLTRHRKRLHGYRPRPKNHFGAQAGAAAGGDGDDDEDDEDDDDAGDGAGDDAGDDSDGEGEGASNDNVRLAPQRRANRYAPYQSRSSPSSSLGTAGLGFGGGHGHLIGGGPARAGPNGQPLTAAQYAALSRYFGALSEATSSGEESQSNGGVAGHQGGGWVDGGAYAPLPQQPQVGFEGSYARMKDANEPMTNFECGTGKEAEVSFDAQSQMFDTGILPQVSDLKQPVRAPSLSDKRYPKNWAGMKPQTLNKLLQQLTDPSGHSLHTIKQEEPSFVEEPFSFRGSMKAESSSLAGWNNYSAPTTMMSSNHSSSNLTSNPTIPSCGLSLDFSDVNQGLGMTRMDSLSPSLTPTSVSTDQSSDWFYSTFNTPSPNSNGYDQNQFGAGGMSGYGSGVVEDSQAGFASGSQMQMPLQFNQWNDASLYQGYTGGIEQRQQQQQQQFYGVANRR